MNRVRLNVFLLPTHYSKLNQAGSFSVCLRPLRKWLSTSINQYHSGPDQARMKFKQGLEYKKYHGREEDGSK